MSKMKLISSLCAIFFFQTVPTFGKSVRFTTNVTLVEAGKPFEATCLLENFATNELTGTRLRVYLFITLKNKFNIQLYDVNVGPFNRVASSKFFPYNDRSLSIKSIGFKATSYRFTGIQKNISSVEYYCNVDDGDSEKFDLISNKINVSAIDHLPRAEFKNTVSQIVLSQPFSVACYIRDFNTEEQKNYTVTFYSQKEGELAYYEVNEGSSESYPLLKVKRHHRVVVSNGAAYAYPRFNLQITETKESRQTYWCSLQYKKRTFISNKWSIEPLVRFTSTNTSSHEFKGSCTVDNFKALKKNYVVKFLSSFGPKAENLIAGYAVRYNQPKKLIIESLSHWLSVDHGKLAYPTYEIVAKVDDYVITYGFWWCVLTFGTDGQEDYREYKSNIEQFSLY